jgi:hypothetical protein
MKPRLSLGFIYALEICDAPGFHFTDDDLLRTGDARTVITNDTELRREILDEAQKS